jgi:hypothetical protein
MKFFEKYLFQEEVNGDISRLKDLSIMVKLALYLYILAIYGSILQFLGISKVNDNRKISLKCEVKLPQKPKTERFTNISSISGG